MGRKSLAQNYVNPLTLFSRHAIAGALFVCFGIGGAVSAQAPPADDAPAAPLDISTGPIADKAPTTRIDVTPGGGVVGIPQAGGPGWIFQGPGPSRIGQVENVGPDLNFDGFPDDEVTGAVHVILPHPTDANIVYIGAMKRGV